MSNNDAILYRCPHCGCLMRDTDEHEEGYNFKKAFIVSLFLGRFWGGLAGFSGNKRFKTQCLRCGKTFTVKR